jgi:hypothetical protein
MKKEKQAIGRSDIIDLPDFSISNIKAKIDTGAYTSSIHCTKPEVIGTRNKKISFYILSNNKESKYTRFTTREYSERNIKNSFGQVERRFIITTKVNIFNQVIETEFSLSNRENMKHPILLGRKFLKGRFIVDVSKFNLSYKKKRKKKKLKRPGDLQ